MVSRALQLSSEVAQFPGLEVQETRCSGLAGGRPFRWKLGQEDTEDKDPAEAVGVEQKSVEGGREGLEGLGPFGAEAQVAHEGGHAAAAVAAEVVAVGEGRVQLGCRQP